MGTGTLGRRLRRRTGPIWVWALRGERQSVGLAPVHVQSAEGAGTQLGPLEGGWSSSRSQCLSPPERPVHAGGLSLGWGGHLDGAGVGSSPFLQLVLVWVLSWGSSEVGGVPLPSLSSPPPTSHYSWFLWLKIPWVLPA